MWHRQEWALLGTVAEHRTRDSRERSEGMNSPSPHTLRVAPQACQRAASLWPSGGTPSSLLLPPVTAQMWEHLVNGAVSRWWAACSTCSSRELPGNACCGRRDLGLHELPASPAGTRGLQSVGSGPGCSLILVPTRVSFQRPLRQHPLRPPRNLESCQIKIIQERLWGYGSSM